MKLTVETKSRDKFNTLISFLRSNGYKVQVHDNPLKDEDWSMPGRAATDEEHEAHARAMENDTDEGVEASAFFDNLIKEVATWK
ncbi:MAG: hypothetical protein KKA07_09320 [Bacteroidetes bacterium]|nr:hypothetical protein [Bacteroidota bacterium]MBU1719260.1 hypothetical protein [Bacteroidota bacterium]